MTDVTLVRAAVRGDRSAFAKLLDLHYDRMYRTAWIVCRDREDAEDVVQTVCVKLVSALASFDGRSAFATWLHRVVVNAARDHQRRRPRLHVPLDNLTTGDTPSCVRDEAADDLWKAVERLPGRQRECVLLVHRQGFSHAEAAGILDVSEATVSWHVHEAKKILRAVLSEGVEERRAAS